MKKILEYRPVVIMMIFFFGRCTPSTPDYFNDNNLALDSIKRIILQPNHYSLIADGISELELNAVLYKSKGIEVLPGRIRPEWVEFYTIKGERIGKYFRTSDISEDTVKLYARLKGYERLTDSVDKENLRTGEIRVHIRQPLAPDTYDEITYPVVFHIIQTDDEIRNYGEIGTFRLYECFNKLNMVFARESNTSPNGVDTKIRFKLAEYTPQGEKLPELGINRFTLDRGAVGKDYNNFIRMNGLDWDYDKYINVWLIMGAEQPRDRPCRPYYISGDADTLPAGISFTKTTEKETSPEDMLPSEGGILMDLRAFIGHRLDIQDITFYFGRYFGLLDNTGESVPNNYCDDTFAFAYSSGGIQNKTFRKKAMGPDRRLYYFTSDNIMDDATGLHKTVTKDQCFRIRTVCKWCPGRQQYRSVFAFSGK